VAFAHVNGVRLWYEVIGVGEPMVLIGGSGLGRQNMDAVIPFLKEHYMLLNFDQRGYGESDKTGLNGMRTEAWADDVVGLMDAVGWSRAHIHGTSFGGMVALAVAIRHPDRCLSVIPNAFFAKPDGARKLMLEVWRDYAGAAGLGRGFAAHIATLSLQPDYLDSHPEAVDEVLGMISLVSVETWQAAVDAMFHLDLSDRLRSCRVPALIIGGEIDTITPIDMSPSGVGQRKTADLLPNSDIVILGGVGHATVLEAPQRHADEVVAFTRKLATAV
jgi:pimeloyl-ACP methyl ester carboxylesterase